MDIIVQKYGGSSVSTLEKLERVAHRVVETKRRGHRVVVVVSAMGNTTDNLLEKAREIMPQPPRRELDMLLSTGERVTMSLLSIAIQKLGEDAISFTGSQSGIVTTDSHTNARIISVRPYRIQDELERDHIVIVAGFQGTSYRNEITTLGRGGSDMTAVALAGALGASACEIYSDVDGVYTADPRVVLDAKKLDELSASEMLLLAEHGAKVLHDEAIAYARRHQVALYAKCTQNPEASGTFIRPDGWPDYALEAFNERRISITSLRKMLFLRSSGRNLKQVTDYLNKNERIKIVSISWESEFSSIMILDVVNCVSLDDEIRAICELVPSEVECRTDYINISIVGRGIGREPSIISSIFDQLKQYNINLHYFNASSDVILYIIDKTEQVFATQLIHKLII